MPARVLPWLPWLIVGAVVWTAAWAAPVWHSTTVPGPFRHFDHQMIATTGWARSLSAQLADLGDGVRFTAVLAVTALLCVLGRSWRALLAACVSLALVLLAVEAVLKPLVDARRGTHFPPSFPSGHTATACCLGTVAILLLGRRHGPLRFPVPLPVTAVVVPLGVVIGPAVGLGMIVVGAHSLIDVLGAPPLAVALTVVACAGVDRLTLRR